MAKPQRLFRSQQRRWYLPAVLSLEGRSGVTMPLGTLPAKAGRVAKVGPCHPDPQGSAKRANQHPNSPSTRRPNPERRARAQRTPTQPGVELQRQAQHIWDTFRLTIWVLLPSAQKKGIAVSAKATIRSIKGVYEWIRNSMIRSGVEWTSKAIKEYANYCRARALGDDRVGRPRGFPTGLFERGYIAAALKCPGQGRLHLAQLARVGRAMPKGTRNVGISSLRKHRGVLSQPMETDKDLLENLRSWATQWARERVSERGTVVNPSVSFSRSASATVSAMSGGQLAELSQLESVKAHHRLIRELLLEEQGFEWNPAGTSDDSIGLLTVADEVADLQILADCAISDALDAAREQIPIPMTATVISELGMKARVVTKPPAWAVVAGNACRKTVWPLLEADRRIDLSGLRPTAEVLDEFHDNLAHSLVGARTTQFYSADLTAATDLMPFDVSRALWNGLCDGLGASPSAPLRSLGSYLLGPVRVSYPDLAALKERDRLFKAGEETEILSSRGCMMGLPVSWTVLNLYNLAMADMACTPMGVPTLLGVAPAVARGDDLVAAIPEFAADRYENLIAATGGEANRLKSFRSTFAFVLAERTFEVGVKSVKDLTALTRRGFKVRQVSRAPRTAPLLCRFDELGPQQIPAFIQEMDRPVEVVALRMSCDLPIRSLLGGMAGFAGGEAVPNYVAIPSAAAACLAEFEGTRLYGAICHGLLSVHRDLVKEMRRSAIPLFYPRVLGGGGFPHPRGFAAAVASAGPLGLQRAGLYLTASGYKARRKVGIGHDPWVPLADSRRMDVARDRLVATDRRLWAKSVLDRLPDLLDLEDPYLDKRLSERAEALSVPCVGFETVPRGARVAVPLDDAVISEAATIAAWEDAVLGPCPSAERRYPTLGGIAERLKAIRQKTVEARFPMKFVPNMKRMGREGFFNRVKLLLASETVLVPYSNRNTARVTVFDPERHCTVQEPEDEGRVEGDLGLPIRRRELRERHGGGVRVLRDGATLGDVAVIRHVPQKRRRHRRTPGPSNRNVL
ncbi:putative RNA-dependent RNA polymerase-like protein [Ochlerotatus-associated narna-like virus 2]|nr:putative RNA-dependent RNA polymerase-like protein [Ochlerotatus-associated narna-like virus 2]